MDGAQGFYRVLSWLDCLDPGLIPPPRLTNAISQHFPTGNLRPVTRLYFRAKIDPVFDTRSRSRSIESREKTPRGIRLAQRMVAGRTAGLPKEPEHANSMLHECLAVSGGPASIPSSGSTKANLDCTQEFKPGHMTVETPGETPHRRTT